MSKVHYHFDHVGSYLRPQALKEAREKFANGEISQEELLKVQDELVKELVHHEVENGLQVVSDGEFGRSWWHLDFLWNLTGFEAYQQEDSYKFHGAKTRTTNVRINGKIAENPNHPFYRDFEYLKSVTPEGITPKVLFQVHHSSLTVTTVVIFMQITMIHGQIFLMIWQKLTMIPSNISTIWVHVMYSWMIRLGVI